MIIVPPIVVTDSILTASNVTEDDYPEWDNVTDYAVGDYVISVATHTVYRCLIAHTVASEGPQDPDAEQAALADPLVADPSPIYWQVISATNRWRAFDTKPSVQVSNAGSITYDFAPGEIVTAIGLFNISADSVRVIMTDPTDGVVYDQTVDTVDNGGIDDWWEYFFDPFAYVTEVVLTDLPPYSAATITVEIINTGETARVGQIAFGLGRQFGFVAVGNSGFQGLDFSFVQLDEFGNLETVRRKSTRLPEFDVVVDSLRLLALDRLLRDLRGGTPAIWIGDEDSRRAALSYGFYRSYRSIYREGDRSLVSIQIQGTV